MGLVNARKLPFLEVFIKVTKEAVVRKGQIRVLQICLIVFLSRMASNKEKLYHHCF
jgi:hypothetical protein